MTCEEQIYSNEYFDFILETNQPDEEIPEGYCSQPVDGNFAILYAAKEGLPPLNISDYLYSSIPKCYTLLDQSALEVSGILKMQNLPTLSLTGQGVLIGVLDTGVAYDNPVFRDSSGGTRIEAIWDQTIPGKTPEGFLYGTEYTREEIDAALRTENPYELVASRDEDGHGTFVAGVAAGSPNYENDFNGAAPNSTLAVVKLKPAKQYLRDFYFIPQNAVAYAENDVMTAVCYLRQLAQKLNMPLVICVALGTNMGSHRGKSYLSTYLGEVGIRSGNVVVVAAGNEGNSRHHFLGKLNEETKSETVEINVGENVTGFTAEIWVNAPEVYGVAVTSPSGEKIPRLTRETERIEYQFVFENTRISIDYRSIGRESGDQLIYIRFEAPTRGIWTIQVSGVNYLGGTYHIWLPMGELSSGEVFFLRSNPDTTVTVPGNGVVPITVGAYDAKDGSLYIGSGRGYTVDGRVKPDFAAPGVSVYGPTPRGDFSNRTGTSASAAVCAGACALFLEWAVINQGYSRVNTIETKNFLIRGAIREPGRIYPNREWGYGRLDLYEAFNNLRTI